MSHYEGFEARDVDLIGISVDEPEDTVPWAEGKGIPFPLLSDPELEVIDQWSLRNERSPELSLHAIYVVDTSRRVYYRKIALRRPGSQELFDAIDYHRGDWPRD